MATSSTLGHELKTTSVGKDKRAETGTCLLDSFAMSTEMQRHQIITAVQAAHYCLLQQAATRDKQTCTSGALLPCTLDGCCQQPVCGVRQHSVFVM